MIYRAIQLIQIFLADGRANGLTKVIQEVLADLKKKVFFTLVHTVYHRDFLQRLKGLVRDPGRWTEGLHKVRTSMRKRGVEGLVEGQAKLAQERFQSGGK